MTECLPLLRPDLRMVRGPLDWDGSVTATIHDPVRDRFFRIGWRERALLTHWHLGSPVAVAEAVVRETGTETSPADVMEFAVFLAGNELLTGPQATAPLLQRAQAKRGLFGTALHGYLFFRVPLISPDRFIAAIQPKLDAILHWRAFPLVLAVMAAWGIIQTLRQWDVFLATLPPVANAGGLAIYGAMLVLSAVVHEFGHAYAARRAGCRVGSMGVAFMVLVPTLYTDLSDAWSLPDRRQRLAIGLAGVAAECAVVVLALALWPLLPEGAARSAMVALATTALVTTLAINLNPLMRFDGYYILSDLLEVPNLQARAFALWTWRLRRRLFGIDRPPPEAPPRRIAAMLVGWAWLAIPWRAMVYLGIALLVYHAVFKLAGMALFAIEVGWFLVRPCWRELRVWWALRSFMRRRSLAVTGGVTGCAILLLVFPWASTVELGGIIEAERHLRLYAPMPAGLTETRLITGASVAEGDLLMAFDAPELAARLRENEVQLVLSRWQVDHLVAQGSELDRIKVEQQALAGLEAERAGLQDQAARLQIRAPFAAQVVDVHPALAAGRWLGTAEPVAAIVDASVCRILAYVEEGDLGRLELGAAARFYPDDPDRPPMTAILRDIDASAATRLDDPYFHADHGGAIAIRRDGARPVPAAAIFRLRLEAAPGAPCRTRLRGSVIVDARTESMAVGLWRRTLGALLAESGL